MSSYNSIEGGFRVRLNLGSPKYNWIINYNLLIYKALFICFNLFYKLRKAMFKSSLMFPYT